MAIDPEELEALRELEQEELFEELEAELEEEVPEDELPDEEEA